MVGEHVDGAISVGRLRAVLNAVPLRSLWRLRGVVSRVQHGVHGDRKSTRLNSSHVKISYAVFCLKKKKKNKKNKTKKQNSKQIKYNCIIKITPKNHRHHQS